jgi:DNA repair protein RadC
MEQILPAVAEIGIKYINKTRANERPQINCSSDAHYIVMKGFNLDSIGLQEQFVVAYLDRSNRVQGLYKLATGGVSSVVCDPRLILGVALKVMASSIILSHNHPSGNLKPSKADEEMTLKIKEGAKLFDVKLLDHIIVTPGDEYFSFADEGLL